MRRRSFILAAIASLSPCPSFAARNPYGSVGVILIGASWCPVCKSAAPVLAALTEPAGIPVLVASHDGRPIAPFPTMVDAANHPLSAGVDALPTTLIYSKERDTIIAQIVGYKNARHYAQSVSVAIKAAALEGRS